MSEGAEATAPFEDEFGTFLAAFEADLKEGTARPLRAYLARFRNADAEAIALEYLGRSDFQPKPERVADTKSKDPGNEAEHVGPYRLDRVLGRGAQGTVHLATDLRLMRQVALKLLNANPFTTEEARRRFMREARLASRLDHPGICPVYESGIEGEQPYIAMRWIRGTSLRELIARQHGPIGEQTTPEAHVEEENDHHKVRLLSDVPATLRLFARIARALDHAHEALVVHRDLKPGNLMVSEEGDPVILDFGLARLECDDLTALTGSGATLGTPAYMAPEQLRQSEADVDRRTDIYALGVTLFESLTGRRPFEGKTKEALFRAILTKDPINPRTLLPKLPRDVATILDVALRKEPQRRYATARAFAEDLEAAADGHPVAARAVGVGGRLLRWARREPALATLVSAIVLLLPSLLWMAVERSRAQSAVEREERMRILASAEERLALAFFELGTGSSQSAKQIFLEAVRQDPSSPEALTGLALAHLESAKPEEALRVIDSVAPEILPKRSAVEIRAKAFRTLGRLEEAAGLERSLPECVEAIDFYLESVRLRLLAQSGDPTGVRSALTAARSAIVLAKAPRILYHLELARTAGLCKDATTVDAAAEALVLSWPESEAARFTIASAHLELWNLEAAIREFQALTARNPRSSTGFTNLGVAYLRKDDLENASIAFEQALKIDPKRVEALTNLGNIHHRRGDLEQALEAHEKAISLHPRYDTAFNNLGLVCLDLGQKERAIESYREALRINPSNLLARSNLGYALLATGATNEALKELRSSQSEAAPRVDDTFAIGNILRDQGNLLGAVDAFRETIRLSPTMPEVHCNLGLALQRIGRFVEAETHLRRGHELGSAQPKWRYDSARWLDRCRALLQMDQNFEREILGFRSHSDSEAMLQLASTAAELARFRTAEALLASCFAAAKEGAMTLPPRARALRLSVLTGLTLGLGQEAENLTQSERDAALDAAIALLGEEVRVASEEIDQGDQPASRVRARIRAILNDRDLVALNQPWFQALLSEDRKKSLQVHLESLSDLQRE